MVFKSAHSSNFKKGRTDSIKYIVIHYTANTGDTAKDNLSYFANNQNLLASAHYFADENEVCQSVKDSNTAYHCGSKTGYKHKYCRNSNSIGIELCSRKDGNGKYYFKDKTIANAVGITKELMQKYNVSVENVVRHYDVTGKICPAPMVNDEKLWKDFLAMLSEEKKPLESGNDIVWELMNGKHKIEITEVQRAIKAIDNAKTNAEFSSLYWILYKIVNK